jgi:hypothetical protein
MPKLIWRASRARRGGIYVPYRDDLEEASGANRLRRDESVCSLAPAREEKISRVTRPVLVCPDYAPNSPSAGLSLIPKQASKSEVIQKTELHRRTDDE